MSSRRQFIGRGVAATALSLAASGPGRAEAGMWPGSVGIGAFIYESGQPHGIEAARVAAGQRVRVCAFDPEQPGASAGELERLVEAKTGAIAGLTSRGVFELVSGLAAARGWPLRHSAPAVEAELLHWIVAPAAAPVG